jgi:putative transposase
VVCCPKYRSPILRGPVAARCGVPLEEIAIENGWQILATEVMGNPVHIFVRVRPTDSPAEVVRKFTGRTAPGRTTVLWSKSYFVASGGYVSEAAVRRYIEHQWDGLA